MTIKDFNKNNFPESPGVYFFKDSKNNILYIGRATSLRDRVTSYFGNDLIQTRGLLLVDMILKSSVIEYIETDSVLEAIILESNEIKKYQPYFNTKDKDNKSYNHIIISDERFPRLIIVRARTLDKIDNLKFKIKYQFGPYTNGSLLKEALKIIRKIFPFRDEKSTLKYQELFYKSIKLSPDIDSPEAEKEYKKTIRNLVLFFQGKKKALVHTLEKEMNQYVKLQEFEKAQKIRDTLYALSHIQDISLIKSEVQNNQNKFRIEAYDIAHMAGKNNVGVMTVIVDGEIQKSQYRKFKLSKEMNNDTACLREILQRRFNHPEWSYPDLIVIDGGVGQLNSAKEIVKNIPIVSVVKNNKHKPEYFLGDDLLIKTHSKSILIANSEAHRFAISYHKSLRNKSFIKKALHKHI